MLTLHPMMSTFLTQSLIVLGLMLCTECFLLLWVGTKRVKLR